jgi:hypothetical protein
MLAVAVQLPVSVLVALEASTGTTSARTAQVADATDLMRIGKTYDVNRCDRLTRTLNDRDRCARGSLIEGGISREDVVDLPITGTPAQARRAVAAYADAGATWLVRSTIGDDWPSPQPPRCSTDG